jgi:hypothetical protein
MSLHPEIQTLLAEFARRRRRLLILRGISGGTVVFLIGTLLAVLIDAPLFLEDGMRLVLAGSVYICAVVAFWLFGLRRFRGGSPAHLGALLEAADPRLGGSFLSAVELSPQVAHADSTAFRASLQDKTAEKIRGLDVAALLPLKLLARMGVALLCAALLIGAGFLWDGVRFGWRCARVLLPLANFERLGDAEITVLQPSPVEGIVPAEETLELEVAVVAKREVEPMVLTKQANGSRLRIPMRAAGPGRYRASVPVEREPLVYQVRAGYSLTRRFQLEPRPRPRVVVYLKTYHYPAYTGLPDRTVRALEGSVSALEGTLVDLTLEPDQPVDGGSLALVLGKEGRELPLEKEEGGAGLFRARFELTEAGAYTVRMVASETGLKSASGPQHSVQIELDAPPSLTLEVPAQDLVVPLGEKVWLEGRAQDDFGLASVALEVRRNETGWEHHAIASEAGRQLAIKTLMDAVAHKARPGDVLGVRFSAFDARGQRGESRILRISIAAPGTVAPPNRGLAGHRALHKQTKELATESAEAVAALEKLKSQSERGTPDELKAGEALARAGQALEKALQAAEAARNAAQELRAESDSPSEEASLRVEARALAVAQFAELQKAKQALEQLLPKASSKAAAVEAARFAHEAASAGSALSRLVEESVRTRLDALEAASLAPAAWALSKEVAESGQNLVPVSAEAQPATLAEEALRRQQVNQTASSQLQGQLQGLANRSQATVGSLRQASEELRKHQTAAEKAVATAVANAAAPADSGQSPEAGASAKAAAATAESLSKSLERTAHSLDAAKPLLQAASERTQTALKRVDRTAGELVEREARQISALAHKQNVPAEWRDIAAELKAGAVADALRASAELESAGGDGSPVLARTLVQAAAALEAPPSGQSSASALGTHAAEIGKLLKPVEGAAAIQASARKAEGLAARINRQNGPPSPNQMAELKELREEAQALPRQLREARLPELSANAAKEAGEALRGAITVGLPKAKEALKAGSEVAAEAAAKALAELVVKAPSLPRQMEQLAAKALEASGATAALAEKSGQSDNPNPQGEMSRALASEAQFERKLDQLRQGLRAEADAQDMRSATGRETARMADGANAQAGEAGNRAQAALQQAASRPSERRPLLERAAAFQKQNGEQLGALAENFKKLHSSDPAERAAAQQALRAGDKQAGTDGKLDARQQRIADLAKLAELAKQSPEKALAQAEAMTSAEAGASGGEPPGGDPSAQKGADSSAAGESKEAGKGEASEQGGDSKAAPGAGQKAGGSQMAQAAKMEMAEANAALKEGGEGSSERAAESFASALDAQAAADRSERAQEAGAGSGGGDSARGLSGMADAGAKGLPVGKTGGGGEWGNLPKRLVSDMLEGKRESAPSEYRDSVEAYFRAVAERARAGAANR